MEVDPQPAVVGVDDDPLDASSHGRLSLGKRPVPKGGPQVGGEPRGVSHGLGHLGLGERIMFQGLQLGLQVLAFLVELGQAPIDKVAVGRRDVVQQVGGGAIEAAEAALQVPACARNRLPVGAEPRAEGLGNPIARVLSPVAAIEADQTLDDRLLDLALRNCSQVADTSAMTDVAAAGVVVGLRA